MLEDESAAGSTIKAGDKDIPSFESKFTDDKIAKKMEEMIGEKVDPLKFWTTKFVLECCS